MMRCSRFKFTSVLLVLLFAGITMNCSPAKRKRPPIAKQGILDLRGWNFKKDGSVLLNGEWEFYWKKLIGPYEFNNKGIGENDYIQVPSLWNGHIIKNEDLGSEGYATYRLKILVSENQRLDLSIDELMSAYKCWCNDNEIFTCGQVSSEASKAMPRQFPVVRNIELKKDTTILTFQISNFHHRAGGFFTSPRIGTEESIFQSRIIKIALDLFLFGAILIISFYHFGLYFMRREKPTALYFGLFTLIMAIRTIFTGSFIISIPFPEISWFVKYRIEYLTLYLSPIFILYFFYSIFEKDINKYFTKVFIIICILYSFTIFLPAIIFTRLLISFDLVLLVSIAYILTRLIKTVVHKRLGARILLSSVLVLFLTTIHDILFTRGYIHNTIEMVPLGTFIFILGQSLVLAKIFTGTFHKNEVLTMELALQNKNLEKNIKERTAELVQQKEELQTTLEHLKLTQAELIQSEKMASLGQLVAGIAHEINTPLGAINASITTITESTQQSIQLLPSMVKALSDDEFELFLTLINRIVVSDNSVTSKEEREFRKKIAENLIQNGIADAEDMAEILVDMGIYDNIGDFIPLINPQNMKAAYHLSMQFKNSKNIKMAVDKAAKVVFALKNYTRSGNDQSMLAANIVEGLETVLTLYQNHLNQGIKLNKEYEEVPSILCYPDELNQVWTNLIHNAIQAMEGKGELSISVKKTLAGFQTLAGLEVCITDTGEGIPPEIKDRIFDAFFTTKAAGEGSGLGLYIVKQIIDKHKGSITFESEVGKGTSFIVFLTI